jgi:hypothetical protein
MCSQKSKWSLLDSAYENLKIAEVSHNYRWKNTSADSSAPRPIGTLLS